MKKKHSGRRHKDRVFDVYHDKTDMFRNAVDLGLAIKKDSAAIAEMQRPKLGALLKHIPDEMDMFPKEFEVRLLLEAVDHCLAKPSGTRFRLWLLTTCAEKLSIGYPELAAQVMEKAAEYVRKRVDSPLSPVGWRNRMMAAADLWLLAGNMEERHEVILHAVGSTLSGTQLELVPEPDSERDFLSPLFAYANEMSDLQQWVKSAKAYEQLAKGHADILKFDYAVLCAIIAASIFEGERNWAEMSRIAMLAEQYSQHVGENSSERFDACLMMGKSQLYSLGRDGVNESIAWLNTARDIADASEEIKEQYRNELTLWQGYAHRVRGELLMDRWIQDSSDDQAPLSDAEKSLSLAVAYFERVPDWKTRELAQCYALLSSVWTALGDVERAEVFRNKAISLGLDLEDL